MGRTSLQSYAEQRVCPAPTRRSPLHISEGKSGPTPGGCHRSSPARCINPRGCSGQKARLPARLRILRVVPRNFVRFVRTKETVLSKQN